MKTIRITLLTALLMASFSCKQEKTKTTPKQNNTETATPEEKQRIVSLSGGITEIISALGYQSEIVGTDVTSTYPESLKTTATELGHVRSMAIEPVMALHPSLILANKKDMNPELLKKLEASGTKLDLLEQEYSVQGTKKLIRQVAEILGSQDYRKLDEKIDADLAQLKPIARKPKVLFIYARGNNLMVAGKGTPMAALIGIAGGENAVNDFDDFKPLTPEALVKANPDVLLFFNSGLQSAGGIDGVLKTPGVAETTAGKEKRIVAMDGGLMSSFGPRLGQAALTLNALLTESPH